jgi:malate synthase
MPDIHRVAAELRRQLLDHDKTVAGTLFGYYGQVYRRLQQQIDSLMQQIAEARARWGGFSCLAVSRRAAAAAPGPGGGGD